MKMIDKIMLTALVAGLAGFIWLFNQPYVKAEAKSVVMLLIQPFGGGNPWYILPEQIVTYRGEGTTQCLVVFRLQHQLYSVVTLDPGCSLISHQLGAS